MGGRFMIDDSAIEEIANVLVNHSVALARGDRVLIDALDTPEEVLLSLVRAVRRKDAYPYLQISHGSILRELAIGADETGLQMQSELELMRMRRMDACILIAGSENVYESSDVPEEQARMVNRMLLPAVNWRRDKTKWVYVRWPSPAMAQLAGMSTEAFGKYYHRICTFDYKTLAPGMKRLAERMDRADAVHVIGPGTDLRFSIKGIGTMVESGERNIPSGEVMSCPIRDSAEGTVQYNVPSIYMGTLFDNIRLVLKGGRIVEASSTNSRRMNQILDSDEGARYIGEFAVGCNPLISEPIRDVLFDEKIFGSFHFTPGRAYKGFGNGNESQVHWDMICIQRPEYGGGKIWFDGELIRNDGRFVPEDLQLLNPDRISIPCS